MAINKVVYGNETLLDLTSDTVEPSKLLKGFKAHNRAGEVIEGECNFDADTSDADAVASEILETKSAYVAGNKIEGTMKNNGAINAKISNVAQEITVPVGYHDGSGKVAIDPIEKAKVIANNIKAGVEMLGVTGTYTGEGVTAQAKTAIPYTDKAQTILPDSDYDYLSQVEIAKIAYAETPNSQGGITVTIGTVAPTI